MRTPNLRLVQLALALAGGVFLYACSKDPAKSTPSGDAGSSDCNLTPGQIPDPTCGSLSCTGAGACTTIDETKCGSKSTCLPLADNAGKPVLDFRIRRLNVIAPPALASSFVQNAVVTKNIDLKNVCGDTGNGAFNWLLRVDKTAGTILTGGAPPIDDPFGTYCFFKHDVNGLLVGPTSGKVTFTGSTFTTDPVDKLNIPIFINGQADNVVILPISNGIVKNVTISPDGNCIGGFTPGALGSDCSEVDNTSCTKWQTGGSLGGYITLEEADSVYVADLSESLCVLLTQTSKGPDDKCVRDANHKITFKGDYCSTTKAAGGCQDAVWMAATFEASAVKIDSAPTRPECTGQGGDDAGAPDASDAGSADAAHD